MSVQSTLVVFTCHLTAGVGLPLAEAVKLAVWPTSTPIVDGWPVTAGAVAPALTVTVAVLVVALLPILLLYTA